MDPAARRRLRLQLHQRRAAVRRRSAIARGLARRRRARPGARGAAAARSRQCLAAQQERRGAPPERARTPRPAWPIRTRSPSSPASRPARSAVRSSPCSRRSPRSSSRAGVDATGSRRGRRVLGGRRGSRLGRDRELYGARRAASSRAPSRWRRPKAPASCRSRSSRSTSAFDEHRRARRHAPAHRVHRLDCSTRFATPIGPARAWPRRSPRGSNRCSGRTASSCSMSADPAAKPLVAGRVRAASCARRDGRPRSPRRPASGSRRCGHAPQVVPQPDSVVALSPRWGTARRSSGRAISSSSATRSYRGDALADEAPSHPEQFSPNVLLRPIVQDTLFPTICYVAGPSELAYLGQLRGVYQHFGVADAARLSRAPPRRSSTRRLRASSRYDVPLEDLQPQDESALNRLLAVAAAASGRAARSRTRTRPIARAMERVDRGPPGRRSRRSPAPRRRRSARWSTSCAACTQGDPGGEEARRDAAPPVHARPGAGLPARPPAGAHARRAVLPESLRPGAGRPAAARNCRSISGSTGC